MDGHFLALIRREKRGLVANLQRAGLAVLSWPYGLVVRTRNRLYAHGWLRSQRLDVPVVGVGNLTVGGTGKTPCVEYVARWYRQHDVRVAILSRGYGATEGSNDEALLLEENLPDVPHLQGSDRVALGRTAIEELESELLILDDGFQHRRLARNLDIVLIDATCPWGYGHVLPRGLLREPVSGLKRAGLVLVTRCDQVGPDVVRQIRERIATISPGLAVAQAVHQPVELVNSQRDTAPLATLHGKPVAAFCGLGNPAAFRKTLEGLGADIREFRTFPDHHAFNRDDIEELRRWSRQQVPDCLVITTQKDLVKIRLHQLGERPLWALRIRLHVSAGEDVLDRKLAEVAGL